MPNRTENKRHSNVTYPKMITDREEKIEFLKSEIKDTLKRGELSIHLGTLFEALMKKTGKKEKEWVDYVNSEFDGISCWAEIKYVFSVKYPQENIEPSVEKEGLKMFYGITSSNLDPNYWYYVTHTSVSSNLKTLAERRLNREITK